MPDIEKVNSHVFSSQIWPLPYPRLTLMSDMSSLVTTTYLNEGAYKGSFYASITRSTVYLSNTIRFTFMGLYFCQMWC